ncbi:MAG: AAA family ATPase [Candidatus Aenigmarchaeota archaeon]|nr:AAA family ATPase [Candidatus Aenigmarchaeota archaeon]
MVMFEKIVVQGFKSFQKKQVIPLYPGFNAIIGPNGSGKSNILDSIVFVLGSASRQLRAGRMDHVIYNGGHGRKPADHSIVSLHIDNTDKTIPDQDEKIVISRRVNRQGQSIYRLNDKVENRTKILEVLAYAGISPDGQSIIQQDDITGITKMRPRERREVIDRVAGIDEYTSRKEKAGEELKVAERNLEDANLILDQKKEYVDKLKKDRDLAMKHKTLEEDRDKLAATLSFSRVKALEGTLENIQRNIGIKESELGSLRGKVGHFDDDLEDKESLIQNIDTDVIKKSVNAEIRREIEDLNARIIKRESQINSNLRETDRLNDMISKMNSIRASKGEDIGNRSVRAILNLNHAGVSGTISNLSSVDPRFEVAINTAAGARLNDIIADSETTAIDCINYLKQNSLGRVRFLPMDRLHPTSISAKAEIASKMSGIIDFAVNLIQFDRKYQIAFNHVFRDTLIAEDSESAKRVRGLRIVTLDGDLFEAGGAIVGGSVRKTQSNVNVKDITDIKEYENAIRKLELETEDLNKEIADLNLLLEEKQGKVKEESKDVENLREQKSKIIQEIDDMKHSRKGQYEQKLTLEAEIQQMRLNRAKLEAELENSLIDQEKYKDCKDLEKGDPQKLQKELNNIDRQLRAVGLVNMKAIEEYDQYEKEYTVFSERVEKLKEERNSIEEMIAKLEEKRKLMFYRTLETISDEFGKIFRNLAEGPAELVMEDPKDIESGLIIKAQPKDKRLLSIDSLSGGEKTLTAIAFLFAIQRYKPSPFYILDEIDAALDKKNSEKIGNLIQQYVDESQFLVISHNDSTVRRSNRIYGVSMQNGISQIMGVELGDAKEDDKKSAE